MEKEKHPLVSTDEKPLKSVWDALDKKQDKGICTDDIPEGKKNLYVSKSILKEWVTPFIESLSDSIDKKQDKIQSSDEIIPGIVNLYFTEGLAKEACIDKLDGKQDFAPSSASVNAALSLKSDKLASSDDLPEGSKNQYFSKEKAIEALRCKLNEIFEQIKDNEFKLTEKINSSKQSDLINVLARIEKLEGLMSLVASLKLPADYGSEITSLKNEIADIKASPKYRQQVVSVVGESKMIKMIVDVTARGVVEQEIEIRGGKISRVFPPLEARPIK